MTRAFLTCLLSSLLLHPGCGSIEQTAPLVTQVCRASGMTTCVSQAYAGEEIELRILGEHFHPRLTIDLGRDDPPEPNGGFLAWLGPLALRGVEPHSVGFLGRLALAATLPGELGPGMYTLHLEAPSGQRGIRYEAFRVRNPITVHLTLQRFYLRPGEQTHLAVRVDNLSAAGLSAVTLHLAQGDEGAVGLPPPPSAFDLPALGTHTEEISVQAIRAGIVQLSVSVLCLAASGLPLQTSAPAQIKLLVQP